MEEANVPLTPQQAIWDDYYAKVSIVANGASSSSAAARGIAWHEARAEAKEVYPKLRAERGVRLRQLRSEDR